VIPSVVVDEWDAVEAKSGLVEVARLQSQVDAARAGLVMALRRSSPRDVRASLVRETGCSTADAARAVKLAEVLERVEGSRMLLSEGRVSADHLRALARVPDADASRSLLAQAPTLSVDAFADVVDRHLIDAAGSERTKRQRAARGVWFGAGPEGTVRINMVLPGLEGEQAKVAIDAMVNRMYRAAHPERAESVSDNPIEPIHHRRADAAIEMLTGTGHMGSRLGVVLVINEERMQAEILGGGPVPLDDAMAIVADARTDLFLSVQDEKGATMRFGRSRRWVSPLQHLALAIRYRGVCAVPGCEQPWYRCHGHHHPPWEAGGQTDIEKVVPVCGEHHQHHHLTGIGYLDPLTGEWIMEPDPAFDHSDALFRALIALADPDTSDLRADAIDHRQAVLDGAEVDQPVVVPGTIGRSALQNFDPGRVGLVDAGPDDCERRRRELASGEVEDGEMDHAENSVPTTPGYWRFDHERREWIPIDEPADCEAS
jgi:hypothetical protein